MSSIGAIASGVKTKFAKGRNPFTGEKANEIDVKSLAIVDDPLPDRKRAPKFKYDEVFKRMKVARRSSASPAKWARSIRRCAATSGATMSMVA